YIAMVSLRELSTSILLYSHGTEVLSIMVFDLWESGEYPALCALGVMMTVLLIILAFVANMVGAKIGIKRVGD
ncbi:MAG: iron ABC transporter permease, partial [Candidatus Neomarinimicrobiota bacterium]